MKKDNKAVEEITAMLERGVENMIDGEEYEAYLRFAAKFHQYSANNCMLIFFQKPDATMVAGFKAWQTKFGRNVKKGEKGIKILAPCVHKTVKIEKDANGNDVEREIRFVTYRVTTVFDISQTEGEPVPELCKELEGTVDRYAEIVERLEKLAPVPVTFERISGGALGYYNHLEKRIAVKEGMSEAQTIKTLIHEIAHSLMHDTETGEEKEADRQTKEVQAESVAFTVCSYLGLDTSDYSFGYIVGWGKGREPKELHESMAVIQKTSKAVIEGLSSAA